MYTLTEKGIRYATQWDYELKNENQHPTQDEPIVRKIAVEPVIAPIPLKETELVDWQTRHIDFLEEVIRNLTTSLKIRE